ncbi:MAG: HEPN domain-containing protein [bacterium]
MEKEEQIEYWLEIAEYDYKTAVVMHKSKRYLYVGFMCHQVIEKAFKALYVHNKSETPPFIHNLLNIAELAGFYKLISDEHKDFVDELLPLNIEARYPVRKEQLYNRIDKSYSKYLLTKTDELFLWIKAKLLKN